MPCEIYPLSLHDALPICGVRRPLRLATESAISASGLILARAAAYYGHDPDRKSTRLNSSHLGISYAVRDLPSFPTRRSSDLWRPATASAGHRVRHLSLGPNPRAGRRVLRPRPQPAPSGGSTAPRVDRPPYAHDRRRSLGTA